MNYRILDEMRVEADAWLRELQETFQEMMLGERVDYQQPEQAEMPQNEVMNANPNTSYPTGL